MCTILILFLSSLSLSPTRAMRQVWVDRWPIKRRSGWHSQGAPRQPRFSLWQTGKFINRGQDKFSLSRELEYWNIFKTEYVRTSKLSFITQLHVTQYEARLPLYIFHSVALIDYWLRSLHLWHDILWIHVVRKSTFLFVCVCVCVRACVRVWRKEIYKTFLVKERGENYRKIFLTSFCWSDLYDIAI